MNITHTPGPWVVVKTQAGYFIEAGRYVVASTGDDAESEANARLIARAPKMKDALRRLLSDEGPIIGGGWDNPYVEEARAILAELEG